jgi:hypothetical protein
MIGAITRLEDVLAALLTAVPLDLTELTFLHVLEYWRAEIRLWSDAERSEAAAWALDVRKAQPMPAQVESLTCRAGPAVPELVAVVTERARIAAYLRAGLLTNPDCPRARFAADLGRAISRGQHDAGVDAVVRRAEEALRPIIAKELGCPLKRVEVRVEPQLFYVGSWITLEVDGRAPTVAESTAATAVLRDVFGAHGAVPAGPPSRGMQS